MKIYIALRSFYISRNLYYQTNEGTILVYNNKYKFEMDANKYPAVIKLSKEKFNSLMSSGNGSLLELDVENERIEEIFQLNKEREIREITIKNKLHSLSENISKKILKV